LKGPALKQTKREGKKGKNRRDRKREARKTMDGGRNTPE